MPHHRPRDAAARKCHHREGRLAGALLGLVVAVFSLDVAAENATDRIVEATLERHIAALSADEFAGRFPGSPAEKLTLDYLRAGFAKAGAQPGNGESYLQEVPLLNWTLDPEPSFVVTGPGFSRALDYRVEMVAATRRSAARISIEDSPLVFAGYGIVAPEYGWNDYAGMDVRGKTVVVLVNDPGFATGEPGLFTGRAMTYYGRWTYKFEEAARQGAAAVLVVHETEPASYGWAVVAQGAGESLGLPGQDAATVPEAEGWLSAAAAESLFAAAGEDFHALKNAASRAGFRARPLGALTADIEIHSRMREFSSSNVVAILPGSKRPDEYVLFTAHWDHLGVEGEEIFNGAVDNASGTAGLLVLAEAYAQLDPPPERTLVFLAVTAEEQGLLGSAHYGAHPVFPLARTAAVINIDGLNYIGPTRDISVIGYGASELDDLVDRVAAAHRRRVLPDPRPEAGSYYRSDHFNLAKRGVPALYPKMGHDLVDGGMEKGRALAQRFVEERYHKPADEYHPGQDWRGAVADLRLYFDIGLGIANTGAWPNWVEGNEFRAIRDAQRPAEGPAQDPYEEVPK